MAEKPRMTLPERAYRDQALFDLEVDRLFGRAWTLVGHVSELSGPGAFLTTTIGREPVLVVRGMDGELRAMSNVCRHRASLLLEGSGTARKVIRCPYHGWTYKLDGALGAAPYARGFAHMDRSTIRLPAYRTSELGGLVFACTDPDAPDLLDVYGDVADFFGSLHLHERKVLRFVGDRATLLRPWGDRSAAYSHRYQEDFDVNWKTMVENYQEDYHVPVGHPSLVRLLNIKETDGADGVAGEYSWVPLRTQPSKRWLERVYQRIARPMPHMPPQFAGCWGNAYLWPATFFEIYPHHVDTWQLFPLGLSATRAVTMTLVDPGANLQDKLARILAHRLQGDVMHEDVTLTGRVVRGLRAPSYDRGMLNDQIESSVIRFHDMLLDHLPEDERSWLDG